MIMLKSLIYESVTDTPEFKQWFRNSKVVDKNGNPLMVFHGTKKDFKIFKTNDIAVKFDAGVLILFAEQELGPGAYFTSDSKAASKYAEYIERRGNEDIGNPQVMPVYLNIENPLDFEKVLEENDKYFIPKELLDPFYKRMFIKYNITIHDLFIQFKEMMRDNPKLFSEVGYSLYSYIRRISDGIIIGHHSSQLFDHDQFVIFNPNQVKSAIGNKGTFDSNDPDITKEVICQ